MRWSHMSQNESEWVTMNDMIPYFAYGSNMDEEQMKARGVPYRDRVHATLEGYALRFNKLSTRYNGTGVANIIPDPRADTEGVLYTLDAVGLDAMDRYEGYPTHYKREELLVRLDSGQQCQAFVYIAQPELVHEGLKPSASYTQHLLVGRDLLSAAYIAWLEQAETA